MLRLTRISEQVAIAHTRRSIAHTGTEGEAEGVEVEEAVCVFSIPGSSRLLVTAAVSSISAMCMSLNRVEELLVSYSRGAFLSPSSARLSRHRAAFPRRMAGAGTAGVSITLWGVISPSSSRGVGKMNSRACTSLSSFAMSRHWSDRFEMLARLRTKLDCSSRINFNISSSCDFFNKICFISSFISVLFKSRDLFRSSEEISNFKILSHVCRTVTTVWAIVRQSILYVLGVLTERCVGGRVMILDSSPAHRER